MRAIYTQKLIISLLFYDILGVTCVFEIMYVYCVCMVEILCNDVLLHISSQLLYPWCSVGSLKSTILGIFKPQKLTNATNQGLFFFHFFWKISCYTFTSSSLMGDHLFSGWWDIPIRDSHCLISICVFLQKMVEQGISRQMWSEGRHFLLKAACPCGQM